jgi:hypothetical protein
MDEQAVRKRNNEMKSGGKRNDESWMREMVY